MVYVALINIKEIIVPTKTECLIVPNCPYVALISKVVRIGPVIEPGSSSIQGSTRPDRGFNRIGRFLIPYIFYYFIIIFQ
jgi:hypothetical protein